MNQTKNKFQTIPGGLLIAFEGIDGSGKTTMSRRTARALREMGYNAICLREPTDGPYGCRLREMMVSPGARDPQREFELFLLDRQEDVRDNILPVLSVGGVVCIDRYYISSMAYQGALGLDADMIRRENEEFAPIPHLILRYVLPIDSALERIHATRASGANEFEKRDYLERVNAEFERMSFPQMIAIDACGTEEEVFRATWTAVSRHIAGHKGTSD